MSRHIAWAPAGNYGNGFSPLQSSNCRCRSDVCELQADLLVDSHSSGIREPFAACVGKVIICRSQIYRLKLSNFYISVDSLVHLHRANFVDISNLVITFTSKRLSIARDAADHHGPCSERWLYKNIKNS